MGNEINIPKISVVINTLNEESNISECIESIKGFYDELLVCDMYSDDRTVELAKLKGARVIYHDRMGFVEPARNYAISCAQNEWVLILDADERMTNKLAKKLREIATENKVDLVLFGVLYNYFGDYVWHGGFYTNNFARFFKKEHYLKTYNTEEANIHYNFRYLEKETTNRIQLSADYFILHEAYPTIEKYINKTIGMYARLEAEHRVRKGENFRGWRLIWEPMKEFLTRFILRKGYLDGWRGFILAVLYSVFRFSVWANIWFLTQHGRNRHDQLSEQ